MGGRTKCRILGERSEMMIGFVVGGFLLSDRGGFQIFGGGGSPIDIKGLVDT